MAKPAFEPLERAQKLAPYVPGLSIAEIRDRYGLSEVIKMASNENPLGTPPLAQEAMARCAASGFRYPQGGNPRLRAALARLHNVDAERIITGNGSDEVIDMLMRLSAEAGRHNVVTFDPCFGIYVSQADINGIERKKAPLNPDFSQNYDALLGLVNNGTRLVFITTPDNPSGYCPGAGAVRKLASGLAEKNPKALLVIDEAYMDFHPEEAKASLIGEIPENAVILRTFSKSYGLAGMRIGYAIVPPALSDAFWRARLPFSINVLAEEAALAALEDSAFHDATMEAVRDGRELITRELEAMGCNVWPSAANFIMFSLPVRTGRDAGAEAAACHEFLLKRGIIIRGLKSYGMPENMRVTIGNERENKLFLQGVREFLAA